MKKYNIVTDDFNYIDLQIFDKLHGYDLYLNNYTYSLDIQISDTIDTSPNIINIRYLEFPMCIPRDLDLYHLIFVGNSDESCERITPSIIEILKKYTNAYMISNSILTNKHKLYGRVIVTTQDIDNWLQYTTSRFYPLCYSTEKILKSKKDKNVLFINGANRTVREYFFEQIRNKNIPYLNTLNDDGVFPNVISEPFIEVSDKDDIDFVSFVNNKFNNDRIPKKSSYYDNNVPIGQNGKLGTIPLGYFLFSEYFEYKCIAFPETSWTNYNLTLTEKALKCFSCGVIPFPIAGAEVNKIYNSIGYLTAHDLLPDTMKFDSISNHQHRLTKAVDALEWLHLNPDVFNSDQAKKIIDQNRLNLFLNTNITGISRLHEILTKI